MIPNNAMLHQTPTVLMNKYFAQIDDAMYKAEQVCGNKGADGWCYKPDLVCPFRDKTLNGPRCKLAILRRVFGEHVKQDDCMSESRECPR